MATTGEETHDDKVTLDYTQNLISSLPLTQLTPSPAFTLQLHPLTDILHPTLLPLSASPTIANKHLGNDEVKMIRIPTKPAAALPLPFSLSSSSDLFLPDPMELRDQWLQPQQRLPGLAHCPSLRLKKRTVRRQDENPWSFVSPKAGIHHRHRAVHRDHAVHRGDGCRQEERPPHPSRKSGRDTMKRPLEDWMTAPLLPNLPDTTVGIDMQHQSSQEQYMARLPMKRRAKLPAFFTP